MGGGIARLTGELAKRYPGETLLISTGTFPGSEDFDRRLPNRVDRIGVRSSRLRTIQGLVLWSHRVGRLGRSFNPGFVWCGNLKPASYPALWLSKRQGVPYGIMLYGSELLLLRHRIRGSRRKRMAAQAILRPASVLTACSEWTRRLALQVLDELGSKPDDIDVRTIPLGTDPKRFRPELESHAVRARYDLNGRRWLLTVARLVGHKGIDTGIKVLSALRETHPDLGYLVVGSGPMQRSFEALAQELGVSDRVRFLSGIQDADLPLLYNCAEIYLGLSRSEELLIEGFGISLSEASASGLPVIAGRDGGMSDAVRDGVTGILVDSTDPAEVAATLRLLLNDAELRRRLGHAGRKAVEDYFNWDRVTADVRRIGREFAS
jgi:phosphatidyl-myo-inositol dimannoside synthase